MDDGYFIENCFALTTQDIARSLKVALETGDFMRGNLRPDVNYWLEDPWDPSVVLLSVGESELQKVSLEWFDVTFGQRVYLRCSCNRRVTKLYLPRDHTVFKCKNCHNLRYRLGALNRYSSAGKALYRMDRLQKLAGNRASMSRIFYNGNYTKRFERFLRLCDRAGLKSIVQGANDLKALLQG